MTVVLKELSKIPKNIRKTYKMVENISPKVAVELAIKVFLTPVKFPVPEREEHWLEKAEKIQVDFNDEVLNTYHWGSGENTILLVHGWCGRASQMGFIANHLVKAGYKCIALDAPGHGESKTKRTTVLDFVAAMQAVNLSHGPFFAIVGHSLGGVASFLGVESGIQVKKLVSISAPASTSEAVIRFLEQLEAKPGMAERMLKKMSNQIKGDVDMLSAAKIAQRIAVPGLIIHDAEDKEVPISQAISVADNYEMARLVKCKGLGHRKLLFSPDISQHIIKFLNE